MYVDPYWLGFAVGIIATVIFEVILLTGICFAALSKKKGGKNEAAK